ncbi:DUF4064 domain-containing protein [Staphylococcus massiliensis]|nr:DUF4064 domain-containing protein [Staphylococcus massiliensis]MCG3402135.1 DUF4064 domain-containing protein [Staphylococcus massiliensis]MCG3413295.1 DUF4064 domain-containing protein [Staphylococcus massiliensis]POA00846.1 DUF4064 domain-containing protein [Staphylococcus massiliensis CCUG 55927]
MGTVLQGLTLLFSLGFLIFVLASPTFIKSDLNADPTIKAYEVDTMYTFFIGFAAVIFILSLTFFILGIIATRKIGKSDRTASLMLIIIGVISLLGNTLAGVLWLIAGIMLNNRRKYERQVGHNQYTY